MENQLIRPRSAQKKIIVAMLIIFAMISLTTVRTSAVDLQSVAKKVSQVADYVRHPFKWAASTAIDHVTDEIFDGLNISIGESAGAIVEWVTQVFTEPFGPSIKTFNEYTSIGKYKALDIIGDFSITVGVFMGTLIWGFSMILYFFTKRLTDMKDNPISLTVRYMIVLGICYIHKTVIDTFVSIIDDLYTAYASSAVDMSAKKAQFLSVIGEQTIKAGEKSVITLLGVQLEFISMPGVNFIILLVQLFLTYKLLKGFVQMYLEMVSRYIVSFIMLFFFGAFSSTMVSNDTVQIFKSYLRTLFSSFLVLIFNILWFKICFYLGVTRGTATSFSIMQYIFLLEMLHIGIRFDSMLRSMGLGVATGVSSLAAAVNGSGRNLANALRNADSIRKSGGGLMKAAGMATGNAGLYNAGAAIGATASDIVSGKVGGNSFAAEMGARGEKMSPDKVSSTAAAGIISDAISDPHYKQNISALNSLADQSLAEGSQNLVGEDSGIKIDNAHIGQVRGADGMRQPGIMVTGTKDGVPFSGVIGNQGSFASGQQLGDNMVLHTDNQLLNGETCDIKDVQECAGSDAAKAVAEASERGFVFPEGTMIEKDGKDSNKQDAFNVIGAGGEQIGTISGDQFTMSDQMMTRDDKADMFQQVSQGIMASGDYESLSQAEEVKGQKGVYKITATDSEGMKKDFTMTDKGTHASSKLNADPESFMVSNTSRNGTGDYSFDVNAGKRYSPDEKGNQASGQNFGTYTGQDSGKGKRFGDYAGQKSGNRCGNKKK